ncbi:MBL fold metallo-hydrolase [Sporomusa acidovorans]|uniref:Ribonuclease BN n=1 Tax=Sporomusa acidovorans (strain ATCC 49682 / DSM 3132 / Mol) TaxID=1123286 RepID=A0ABZ3IXQ4_SPOA4|nr:MBL fold metallo-hydrolase [Sporomusa acidovorans]OZC15818.1 ribonuclease BN [Sporomusa acidovorans DSM 3132]SDF30291.1 7,8-dihydropterin-6-yl-methyl-4-(beta-D-ribofuranosyl)aminobenzene 5'-phosphate synthase [Sporomusa acidovorans]
MIKNIPLLEVDEVKITIVMDNTIDAFMTGNEFVHRFDCSQSSIIADDGFSPLIAEHGFSAMIQVKRGSKQETVLLDAGISPNGILHNMSALGINSNDIQAIILSHGHIDHTMGLPSLIEKLGSHQVPLIFHPDAFLNRKVIMPGGYEVNVSSPQLTVSQQEKIAVVKKTDPTLLAENMILVSGEIDRTTDFETGFPIHYTKRKGKWENDPAVKDDQCVIVNVRGKGLVVITGCCHSGLINTINYAQTLTNCQQIYAVLGGFHLTGGIFEKIIPATITELQKINPAYLMPGHCTGWSAIHQIAQAMPKAFVPNNVGTTLLFQADS